MEYLSFLQKSSITLYESLLTLLGWGIRVSCFHPLIYFYIFIKHSLVSLVRLVCFKFDAKKPVFHVKFLCN
jgi:hypothetical protein